MRKAVAQSVVPHIRLKILNSVSLGSREMLDLFDILLRMKHFERFKTNACKLVAEYFKQMLTFSPLWPDES